MQMYSSLLMPSKAKKKHLTNQNIPQERKKGSSYDSYDRKEVVMKGSGFLKFKLTNTFEAEAEIILKNSVLLVF